MLPLPEAVRVLAAAGLVPDLATEEVQTRLLQGLRLKETGLRILAFYLEEMDRRRLHIATGHESTAFYALEVLEMEKQRTCELLSVGRKLLTLPRIDAAFCAQKLGWSKVLYLLEVATPEHEEAWLARALGRTCSQLRGEVRSANRGDAPRKPGDGKGTPEVAFEVRARVGRFLHEKLERAQAKLSAECERSVTVGELLEEMADLYLNLEVDGTVPGRRRVSSSLYRIVLRPEEKLLPDTPLTLDTDDGPVPVDASAIRASAEVIVVEDEYPEGEAPTTDEAPAPKTPAPKTPAPKTPARLREEVVQRDGCRCRCCGSRYDPHVHHIRYRSEGGPTRGANLADLCPRCHALVHEGLLIVEGEDARHIRFKDRQGRYLNEPGSRVDPAALMVLIREVPDQTPTPEPVKTVTLDDVPAVIDGAWWRRYADLIRCARGTDLVLREGAPLPEEPEDEPVREAKPDPDGAFAGLVGMDGLIRRLRIRAEGRAARGRPFPHTLFRGPAGTGKTTLARGVAALVGTRLHATTGPLLQDAHALVRILAEVEDGDVLFLDEIHAVPRETLEVLYEAMAERRLELTFHAGSRTRFVRLALPAFTLLAATTEGQELSDALTSRFGLRETLGFYDAEDLVALARGRAREEGTVLDPAGTRRLAACARGTPREVLRILDLVLDEVGGRSEIPVCANRIDAALEGLGFDHAGLRAEDRRYLSVLGESGGAVSLARLSRMLGLSPRAVERDIETHLLRERRIVITPRGRCLPGHERGRSHPWNLRIVRRAARGTAHHGTLDSSSPDIRTG